MRKEFEDKLREQVSEELIEAAKAYEIQDDRAFRCRDRQHRCHARSSQEGGIWGRDPSRVPMQTCGCLATPDVAGKTSEGGCHE